MSSSAAIILPSRVGAYDPPRSQRSAKILESIEALFNYVDAGRVAETNGTIVSERRAGDNCNVSFTQETVGKILRSQTELTDINQNIKRALRFNGGHVRNLGDAIEHVIPPHIELFTHVR